MIVSRVFDVIEWRRTETLQVQTVRIHSKRRYPFRSLDIATDNKNCPALVNMRTIITIPKDLKKKLEKIAKQDNRSFNNLVIKILKDFVSNSSPT